MFSCSQWLVMDNQETCYPSYFVTKKHYQNRRDVDKDYAPQNTEYCFHPIRPIKESKLTGELAEDIYRRVWREC